MRFKLLLILLLILAIFCGCNHKIIDKEHIGSQQEQIINGELAEHKDFPSIATIIELYGNTPFCTGTLIKPDLVLTAAHCVSIDIRLINVVYGYNEVIKFGDNEYISLPVLASSKYDGSEREASSPSHTNVNDIGLLLIDSSISPVNIIFSHVLPSEHFDEVLNIGDIVTIAGYGQDISGRFGHLHYGTAPITWINDTEMIIGEHIDEVENAPNACFGDSGGPVYVDYFDQTFVTGIASRAPDVPICGFGTVYTIPGRYLQWIEDQYIEMKNNNESCEECEQCESCNDCEECDTCNNVPIDLSHEEEDGCNISFARNCNINVILYLIIFLLILKRRYH